MLLETTVVAYDLWPDNKYTYDVPDVIIAAFSMNDALAEEPQAKSLQYANFR